MTDKKSWDKITEECYDRNLSFTDDVIQVIYTDAETERAVILQRSDRLITIVFEKLSLYDDNELMYIGEDDVHGYWHPYNHNKSIFDTEESAVNAVFSEPPFKKSDD